MVSFWGVLVCCSTGMVLWIVVGSFGFVVGLRLLCRVLWVILWYLISVYFGSWVVH